MPHIYVMHSCDHLDSNLTLLFLLTINLLLPLDL